MDELGLLDEFLHLHHNASARAADLDQLELAGSYQTRSGFLTELTLDPPGHQCRRGCAASR
jgi:hypothetical protein